MTAIRATLAIVRAWHGSAADLYIMMLDIALTALIAAVLVRQIWLRVRR